MVEVTVEVNYTLISSILGLLKPLGTWIMAVPSKLHVDIFLLLFGVLELKQVFEPVEVINYLFSFRVQQE